MRSFRLEEFGLGRSEGLLDPLQKARDGGHRDGFEEGYSSGWEDAQKSMEDKRLSVSEELARAISEARLTTESATETIRAEAICLIDAVLEKVLQPVLTESAGLIIQKQVRDNVENALDVVVTVSANTSTQETMRGLIEDDAQVSLEADDTLADDQVILGIGAKEAMIDLTSLVKILRSELQAARSIEVALENKND